MSSKINTAPPPDRTWVMIRHADPDRPIATFTVLCYNVLCDKYATVNQYSYCPSWALNWEYRKMSIMKEIRNYEADIITLQAIGYTGIFSPKSRAKTMNEEDRKYVDGCAIFWKSDKFEMDREHLIEFTQVVVKKASSSEHMLNRVMPRDNIALCAVLRIKDNVYANRRLSMAAADNVVGNPLVVCTAHIHWDPEFCDVKLVQTMMLAHELHKLLEEVAAQFRITPQQTPVLICGDLNSLPDSGFRNDACIEKFSSSIDVGHYSHSLRLDSAVDVNSIPFTNYTYVFSSSNFIKLHILSHQFLKICPLSARLSTLSGFPHPHVPSDHIPIMAQYAVIPTSHQRAPPPPHQALPAFPR
uniref:Endo/exonuclease/phosphatase domain-containing protein n=1 Tax=Heterorhabditis bacteriophora TaxID=37862 RepID=A0A1I7XE19_HETBA